MLSWPNRAERSVGALPISAGMGLAEAHGIELAVSETGRWGDDDTIWFTRTSPGCIRVPIRKVKTESRLREAGRSLRPSFVLELKRRP